MAKKNSVTYNLFYEELKKKVSDTNAKLLLHGAAIRTGLSYREDDPMNVEDAQALCLELIKSGGPGFHVGKSVYSQMTK